MSGWRTFAVLLVVTPALSLSGTSQSRDTKGVGDRTIAVGLACGDGTFIPLAARTRGTWTALSEPKEGLSYFFGVLTPQALRLPRQGWTLYLIGGGSPRPLALGSPHRDADGDGSECVNMQGFDSEGGPRVPGRVAFPDGTRTTAPIVGMGVLDQARFERGGDVTAQPDETSRRVAARVVREVHAAERRLDRDTGSASPLRQFDGRKDVRSVVRLLSMVRHQIDAGEWYFFQARKQYGEPYVFEGRRMYRNWAQVLVHGWVRVSSAGISAFPEKGSFDDDTLKMGRSYRLAGLLILDDRVVWITEGFGYEWQWYELFETGPGDTPPHSVLKVDTGGA